MSATERHLQELTVFPSKEGENPLTGGGIYDKIHVILTWAILVMAGIQGGMG